MAGQLRSAGLVSAVEIARVGALPPGTPCQLTGLGGLYERCVLTLSSGGHAGFPSRQTFDEFASSFRVLAPPTMPTGDTLSGSALVKAMLASPLVQIAFDQALPPPWLLGKTKVFFEAGVLDTLAGTSRPHRHRLAGVIACSLPQILRPILRAPCGNITRLPRIRLELQALPS